VYKYPETLRALSIMNPFAWEICVGLKPLEFRSWDTKFRGLVLLHCSSSRQCEKDFAEFYPEVRQEEINAMRGSIIGFATAVDSFWREEDQAFCHEMREPGLLLQPIECSGALNYWRPQGKHKEQQTTAFKSVWDAIQSGKFVRPDIDTIDSCRLDYGLQIENLSCVPIAFSRS